MYRKHKRWRVKVMEYRRFSDTIVLRVDPGEEICRVLLDVAEKENIDLAHISGLGAINRFTTGVFDTVQKEYHANHFEGLFEIVSLTGTLTRKDGEPYLHAHLSAGDREGHVFGGHLNEAYVSATAEIIVRVIDGKVNRRMDERIGLNLYEFE